MSDRTLFLLDEIACMFVDDFMVLPSERIMGNVYAGLTPAVQRHEVLWAFTH